MPKLKYFDFFRSLLEAAAGSEPKQRQPDIAKVRRLLGWEPRVPPEEGLRETIDYFRHAQA